MKSEFLKILQERGFIHQTTDDQALDALLCQKKITAYLGYEATADSLHVGHLVTIMMLYWLQQTGHKPIVLMGGATSRVGDPSGKDEQRQLLDEDAIAANIQGIKRVFTKFLNFGSGETEAIMLNNADWLQHLNYIDFLRDYGRHFSVNRMLTFDSVRMRLEREQSLSFLEFSYMILQAYDFLELNRRYDCVLQLGGSDQWGNILNGVDLTRKIAGKHVFGLTTPLITTSSGAKMGKTASGAVWLNADRLSPYDYWQFWRNTEDADVARYLRLFTTLPMDEIERLEQLQGSELNEAKKVLADSTTSLAHGAASLTDIHATVAQLFENQSGDLGSLPTFEVSKSEIEEGLSILDLFCCTGLTPSKAEARRLIQGQGARLNDQLITDEMLKVTQATFADGGVIKLSAGKKRHAVVRCG